MNTSCFATKMWKLEYLQANIKLTFIQPKRGKQILDLSQKAFSHR